MFYVYKICLKIKRFLFPKLSRFFSVTGLAKIPWVRNLASAVHTLRKKCLPNSFYEKFKPKGIVLINIQGNKMYVDTDDKDIAPKLLIDGFREEKYETMLFRKTVKEGMVVVDIGAHIGYYSLIGARLVGKSGIIYAFEPMSRNYELLCKNIEANNFTNIAPVKKVVSNKYGKAKFWFEKDWRGSPSLSKHCVLSVSKHDTLEDGGFVEVETVSLDEFFENEVEDTKVDIIKVDAGGAEGFVIEGCEKILRNNEHLKIFLEFWPDALKDLGGDPLQLLCKLQEHGFEIKFINEVKQTLEPINTKEEKYSGGPGFNLLLER